MLTNKISGPLQLLRVLGLYPSGNLLAYDQSRRQSPNLKCFIDCFLYLITLIFTGINLAMVGFTVFVVNMFREEYGIINVYTISSIITGEIASLSKEQINQ